jgi:hypothetical protein
MKLHQGQEQLCFLAHLVPDYTIKNQQQHPLHNIKKTVNDTFNQGNTAR